MGKKPRVRLAEEIIAVDVEFSPETIDGEGNSCAYVGVEGADVGDILWVGDRLWKRLEKLLLVIGYWLPTPVTGRGRGPSGSLASSIRRSVLACSWLRV